MVNFQSIPERKTFVEIPVRAGGQPGETVEAKPPTTTSTEPTQSPTDKQVSALRRSGAHRAASEPLQRRGSGSGSGFNDFEELSSSAHPHVPRVQVEEVVIPNVVVNADAPLEKAAGSESYSECSYR